MGACLSKKKASSSSTPSPGSNPISIAQKTSENGGVTVTLPKPEVVSLKNPEAAAKEEDEAQLKKEIFIIKHRKSHDDRERNSKIQPCSPQKNLQPQQGNGSASSASSEAESMGKNKVAVAVAPSTPNMAVRTSSCTKEEVDAILIQCGRLSRSSSGRAASSSAGSGGRKYSGSKRSFDFDHCDNDAVSAEDDTKRANGSDNSEEYDAVAEEKRHHQHRQRHRQSPRPSSSSQGRRRTPSRERDQQNQRSSSRERRVSRSPGRRTSETTTNASNNNSNNNNNTVSRPGKLVSVPATVTSLVMDKSNNGGGGGGETKRVTVKRNAGDGRGAASPRSQSPARANGIAANGRVLGERSQSPARANGNAANGKVLGENQQQQHQPSLSRNNSGRKAEHSPYRRNPLSEVDPNSLAYPQSNNNGSTRVQHKPKKEIEAEANQKSNIDIHDNSRNRTNSSRVALEKGVAGEEIKALSSLPDNAVVKTVIVPSGVDNHKPQTLTRSRSSRRSRDLDINPETLLNPPLTYTSLLLEDIHNFHQKNTQQPSVSLPACLTKACSILEAVADLNSTTSSNFSGTFSEDKRNEHNGKRVVADSKDPFVESEVVVSDDVMEPSLHKYVTVKRGGSLDMEDQESSGSNSFSVSSGQQHWGVSSSSWEPNSADSTDSWTSRLNNSREECQKCPPLGLGGGSLLSSDMVEARKKKALNSGKKDCDHQHSGGIGRGRLGFNKGLHNTLPVVTASASR